MAPTLRILIAEDDEASRLSLGEFLVQKGFACSTAADACQAAELLRQNPIDLVISDICMAGNENLEFVKACATSHPPLPVILVTGFPRLETAVTAVNLKLAGYLLKPVDLDELLRMVQALALRHHLQSEIRLVNQRLAEWKKSLRMLEQDLSASQAGTPAESLNTYISLCFENISASLDGLRQLVHSSVGAKVPGAALSRTPTPLLIIEALREAIDVLERTKDAFRSKELAELRRKLERLLQAGRRDLPPGPLPSCAP